MKCLRPSVAETRNLKLASICEASLHLLDEEYAMAGIIAIEAGGIDPRTTTLSASFGTCDSRPATLSRYRRFVALCSVLWKPFLILTQTLIIHGDLKVNEPWKHLKKMLHGIFFYLLFSTLDIIAIINKPTIANI